MNTINHIFLDFDGPLLNGQYKHYHCYRTILEKFGYSPIEPDIYWLQKRALMNRRELLKQSGAESIYEEFLADWLKMIESPDALNLDRLQEGAIECLQNWKDQGIRLTLVTMRQSQTALDEQLSSLQLRPLLDTVLRCGHAAGGEGKATAVRSQYPDVDYSTQAVWIGDTEADWKAAQSLNCPIILLENGLRNRAYLSSLGTTAVMPSIASLKNQDLRKYYAHS